MEESQVMHFERIERIKQPNPIILVWGPSRANDPPGRGNQALCLLPHQLGLNSRPDYRCEIEYTCAEAAVGLGRRN